MSKNLITYYVWHLKKEKMHDIETFSIDRVLNKKLFYGKNHVERLHQKLVPGPFLILMHNPKQLLQAPNTEILFERWYISETIPLNEVTYTK